MGIRFNSVLTTKTEHAAFIFGYRPTTSQPKK